MLRDAEATIRDLREKLATANQTIHTMRAELAAEPLAGQVADDAPLPMIAVHETVVATVRDAAVPIIRRPVGRPRKMAAWTASTCPSLVWRSVETRACPIGILFPKTQLRPMNSEGGIRMQFQDDLLSTSSEFPV
jgi:hypothetical protein